ncbi:DNA mismatch repair protein MutS [Bacteroidia bacterium]|nr:DNA mismatch repair protein MutS [Bacteroidia bacterium]
MSTKVKKETPLMKQYHAIKVKHPGALLLFRVGDFYETFGQDAIVASKILGIVLTKRANGSASHIELAGFPHHSLDTYLPKLVRAGQRVAICDQLEDPKKTKTIVKRGVTELVTPGVSYNDNVLDANTSNFLAAVHYGKDQQGIAFLDISTGEFLIEEGDEAYISKLLGLLKPAEVIVSKDKSAFFETTYKDKYLCQYLDDWIFQYDYAYEQLTSHFKTSTLKGFGIEKLGLAIIAAGACLTYLEQTHHKNNGHIDRISRLAQENYVWIDEYTARNLELIYPTNPEGKSLLNILDQAKTPMGSRTLKKWLILPLKDVKQIQWRLDTVEHFMQDGFNNEPFDRALQGVGDLERLVSKVALRRVGPRDVKQLERSLNQVAVIQNLLKENKTLAPLADKLADTRSLVEKISSTLSEEPPAAAGKGGTFASGFNETLDEYTSLSTSGKSFLEDLKNREVERTGISSLKISFNNVFGYYLEVTHAHKDKVPEEWIRKQTLVNAERYITDELKGYEDKILKAESQIEKLEIDLFETLVTELQEWVSACMGNAHEIATIDILSNFARLAQLNHYCKPEVDQSFALELTDCRHPVIEQNMGVDEEYIPNSIRLDNEKQRMVILTGPNMSGKSAVLRQTALAAVMAQMGCFVAAKHAKIGVVDKVFTRVGASDNLSLGESTFMVEMIETASILNNVSNRSLIILDEIGRGTATFDGISLAWSIAEFLCNHPEKPKTLFATHYHELNELEAKNEGIKNFHISIKEYKDKIIFLRKLAEGGTESSFGIHVAKMAGVPATVLQRAELILNDLEKNRSSLSGKETLKQVPKSTFQMNMFQVDDPAMGKIRQLLESQDINRLSPVEALLLLNEMKQMLEE